MLKKDVLNAQVTLELPAREMLQRWGGTNVTIAVPTIIQNNFSIQVCGLGCTQHQGGQWNLGNIGIYWPQSVCHRR